MSNEHFQQVIDSILECEELTEKVEIISLHIHSLADYMDMLAADCLFGEEYTASLETLGDIELAVLGETIFYEELSCGRLQLLPEKTMLYKKNMDAEWQERYIDCLFHVSEERRKRIEELINQVG
jgi:hypothetical protein